METGKRNLTIALFLIISAIMLWGNVFTPKGDDMENALPDDNKYTQSDLRVEKEFGMAEGVRIVLKTPDSISEKEIKTAIAIHENLYQNLDMSVVSLANLKGYRDVDDILHEIDFMWLENPMFATNGSFDIQKWKKLIVQEPGLMPAFVGRNFDYLSFVVYPPKDMDEIQAYREITQVVEGREISEIEWLTKADIEPKNPHVETAGWMMGRGLVEGALNAEVMKKVTMVGMTLAFLAFFAFTRSIFQAALATFLVVGSSVLWTRGEIGLLHMLGFGFKERVYSLLAYTNCIVQGISFSLHLFDAYSRQRPRSPWLRWQFAKKEVYSALRITAIIACVGFATLFTFEVGSIRELGIVSALGVINLFLLAIVFLPVFHSLLADRLDKKLNIKALDRVFDFLDFVYKEIVGICHGISAMLSTRTVCFILIWVVAFAIFPALNGKLLVGTKPLDYLKGTAISRSSEFMNEASRPGFDVMELYTMPSTPNEQGRWIYDPAFMESLRSFSLNLRLHPEIREVFSVLDTVAKISRETLDKEFPTTRQEFASVFQTIEGSVDAGVLENFYNKKGIRLSIGLPAASSRGMGKVRDIVEAWAERYSDLEVLPFGKVPKNPSMDEYIIKGKPLNVLTSQFAVIVLLAVWTFFMLQKSFRISRIASSVKVGIAMSVPFLFSSALIVIVMMVFGIHLDVSTAAIGALAINASIDFSIYWTAYYLKERKIGVNHYCALSSTMETEGKVVLGDTFLNMICFAPMFTSIFLPVQRLGWMMVVMLGFAAIGALILMPPLLKWAVKD